MEELEGADELRGAMGVMRSGWAVEPMVPPSDDVEGVRRDANESEEDEEEKADEAETDCGIAGATLSAGVMSVDGAAADVIQRAVRHNGGGNRQADATDSSLLRYQTRLDGGRGNMTWD